MDSVLKGSLADKFRPISNICTSWGWVMSRFGIVCSLAKSHMLNRVNFWENQLSRRLNWFIFWETAWITSWIIQNFHKVSLFDSHEVESYPSLGYSTLNPALPRFVCPCFASHRPGLPWPWVFCSALPSSCFYSPTVLSQPAYPTLTMPLFPCSALVMFFYVHALARIPSMACPVCHCHALVLSGWHWPWSPPAVGLVLPWALPFLAMSGPGSTPVCPTCFCLPWPLPCL